MQEISPKDLADAERILEAVASDWLLRPGVTAIDLGFKWSHGEMTHKLAIRVHVTRKLAARDLAPAEIFPKEVGGLPVDVLEANYSLPPAVEYSTYQPVSSGRWDAETQAEVIPIGVSVSNPYTTAGTLGAKVIDLDSGREMMLSNWHVLAGLSEIDADTPVWQPGRVDGGTARNTVGALSRWVIGPYDAAVARLNQAIQLSSKTPDGLSIEASTPPLPGMTVWKYGRTSGYTEGVIDGTRGIVPLEYPQLGSTILLRDIVRILPVAGHVGEISMPGDSGAVWVEKSSGRAVGLHCAGETGMAPEYALAHDIGPVMRTLFVKFPGEVSKTPVENGSKRDEEHDRPATSPPHQVTSPPPSSLLSLLRFLRRMFRF